MHAPLVVLGGGPGGYAAAFMAADLGMEVTLVEKDTRLGGTCLLRGCIPSKALLDSSHHYYDAVNHFDTHGISIEAPKVDFSKMVERKADEKLDTRF